MVTTRPNGNFNGTLHHKGESSEYYVEQSERRPRRQRVLAIVLVLLSPVFLAYAVVDLPRPNVQATVVGLTGDEASPSSLVVSYTWRGEPTTAVIDAGNAVDALRAHPVGSTLWVHAGWDVYDDKARAALPVDQPVAGPFLTLVCLLSAVFLWRAARRNEARGPLVGPVLLDPR